MSTIRIFDKTNYEKITFSFSVDFKKIKSETDKVIEVQYKPILKINLIAFDFKIQFKEMENFPLTFEKNKNFNFENEYNKIKAFLKNTCEHLKNNYKYEQSADKVLYNVIDNEINKRVNNWLNPKEKQKTDIEKIMIELYKIDIQRQKNNKKK